MSVLVYAANYQLVNKGAGLGTGGLGEEGEPTSNGGRVYARMGDGGGGVSGGRCKSFEN